MNREDSAWGGGGGPLPGVLKRKAVKTIQRSSGIRSGTGIKLRYFGIFSDTNQLTTRVPHVMIAHV